jgi:CRISPR/Cas system-associated endonuclease Cas1
MAVVSAHLDPYLGYLHSTRMYHPALVSDMLEPWRIIAEEFVLDHLENLNTDSFMKKGKRNFLKRDEQINFTNALDKVIDKRRIPYNRRGNSKTTRIRTAIKEEPRKLAQYLRGKLDVHGLKFNK